MFFFNFFLFLSFDSNMGVDRINGLRCQWPDLMMDIMDSDKNSSDANLFKQLKTLIEPKLSVASSQVKASLYIDLIKARNRYHNELMWNCDENDDKLLHIVDFLLGPLLFLQKPIVYTLQTRASGEIFFGFVLQLFIKYDKDMEFFHELADDLLIFSGPKKFCSKDKNPEEIQEIVFGGREGMKRKKIEKRFEKFGIQAECDECNVREFCEFHLITSSQEDCRDCDVSTCYAHEKEFFDYEVRSCDFCQQLEDDNLCHTHNLAAAELEKGGISDDSMSVNVETDTGNFFFQKQKRVESRFWSQRYMKFFYTSVPALSVPEKSPSQKSQKTRGFWLF